ncbi:hypothetical protein ACLIYM_27030 [Streptomyces fenghuangensis]|uniref:transporter n=1 Tax=Streptomyces sp. ICN903 TaxID=2964654 RepID=UPI001EDC0022|nr:transporter [Streptomyces sp. ICN903]MCG3042958.1 transporter [Streptomyces sp. ICN903]
MRTTPRKGISRGNDALVAVLLLVLDAIVISVLFYLVVVSYGFDAVPDREAAAGMAAAACAVCAVGAVLTAVPAFRVGAWITFTVQTLVLGGSALFSALLAVW